MVKVFISWSGDLSGDIAESISKWLPKVLRGVIPYCTFPDIEKGEKWNSNSVNELKNSKIGIICLTEENLANPWILLEYYTLSQKSDTEVFPFIFGSNSTDLTGPFAGVATIFKESNFKKLVESINKKCGDSLVPEDLNQFFDDKWKEIENKIEGILKSKSNILHSGVLEGLVCGYRSLKNIVHKDDDESLRKDFEKMQKSLDFLALSSCDAAPKEIWDIYREARSIKIIDPQDDI